MPGDIEDTAAVDYFTATLPPRHSNGYPKEGATPSSSSTLLKETKSLSKALEAVEQELAELKLLWEGHDLVEADLLDAVTLLRTCLFDVVHVVVHLVVCDEVRRTHRGPTMQLDKTTQRCLALQLPQPCHASPSGSRAVGACKQSVGGCRC